MELHHLSNSHIRSELGRRARAVRKARGLNQTQLAERADLTRPTVSTFERGNDVSLGSFLSILRALDMLDALGAAIPESTVSPIAELSAKQTTTASPESPWTWGDEAQ